MSEARLRFARYALLDRDGTIIVDKAYLADPKGIEFTAGAVEGLKLLRDAGFGLILITNQSGIARGYFSEDALARIHRRLRALLEAQGIGLEAIYYCPHGPNDKCRCRKPAPGLVIDAITDFGFAPSSAIFIGDEDADMGAAAAAGIKGVRLAREGKPDNAAVDFLAAAHLALDHFR